MDEAALESPEEVVRMLEDQRRRTVLAYLRDTGDGGARFDDVVDAVVEAETHSPSPDRNDVLVDLFRDHFPALRDASLVAYDTDAGTLTTTDRFERVESTLELHAPAGGSPATGTDDTDATREEPPGDDASGPDTADRMVVFEFAIPADAVVLGEALRACPDVVVRFERLVPTNHDLVPYLWASDGETAEFEDAIADDPQVECCRRVATFDEGALYELKWDPDDGMMLNWLSNSHEDVTLLQAEGHDGEWALKLRFPSREMLADFWECHRGWDRDLRVVRLYDLSEPKLGQYDVTEKQRETLVRALEMGYFEVPREATLRDVAEALGISAESTSERLRRGQTNLVGDALTVGRPTGVGLDERPDD